MRRIYEYNKQLKQRGHEKREKESVYRPDIIERTIPKRRTQTHNNN